MKNGRTIKRNKTRCYSTKVTEKDWSKIIGKTGTLQPAHHLANEYLRKGKLITALDVNKVLAFAGIKITQTILDEILSRPRLVLTNLDSSIIRSDYFLRNIGTYRGKIQVPGVYIWTHLSTGDKYVGSSSVLARRLIGYINGTHRTTGKLIPLIKRDGIGAFKLEIMPLIESYSVNQELSLEQYFLLHSEFNLNTLRVVNNYSGARAKPLYMYTKDLSELIYCSDIQEDFIFKLGIHHNIFSKSLKTGDSYLDKYVFTDKPILGAKENDLSLSEINNKLDKDRVDVQNAKGRKIHLKAVDDNNDTLVFNSVNECITFLSTKGSSNKTTLYRRIEAGKPYNGYICQWESEETSTLLNKSVEVSVTHVPTNVTVTYSSFRKAALSFAPQYITGGQTLKTYAETGKLFKGEYKITSV